MNNQDPWYFYIAHLRISHPLIQQKIISIAKIFTDECPDSMISFGEGLDGYSSLAIQSKSPISPLIVSRFEKNLQYLEGVNLIFSQETMNIKNSAYPFPPTYVCTSYFTLHFNVVSYYLGRGLLYRVKLKKYLDKITGGVYYLKFYRHQMAVIIESTEKFDETEVAGLWNLLSHQKICLKTSFCNF